MNDLSQMSDADLMAALGRQKQPRGIRNNNPGNIEDGPFAKSQRGYKGSDGRFAVFDTPDSGAAAQGSLLRSYGARGINNVEGIVNRWAPPSENDTGGYVQFVAQRLGVDPKAQLDLSDERVLSRLQQAMADKENGEGGSLAAMSDAELMASLGGGGGAKPRGPAPGLPAPPKAAQRAPVASTRSTEADATLGLFSGAGRGGAGLLDTALQASPLGPILGALQTAGNLGGALQGKGPSMPAAPVSPNARAAARDGYVPQTDAGKVMQTVGSFLPNAAIPGSLPQRILNVLMPSLGLEGAERGAKAAGLGEQGQKIAGVVGAGLGGATTGLRMGPAAARVPKADPATLRAEKTRLYGAVEDSGFKFTTREMDGLAGAFEKGVREMGGPKAAQIVPGADAMAARLGALAKQKGGVTLSQLDRLRGDIYDTMISKGGAEAKQGYRLRGLIDDLMDKSRAPYIKEARAANTRFEKVDEVTRRTKSADLAAGRANSGGNKVNAQRQKLSPMVDPLHSGEVKNLTADERKLIGRIVKGDLSTNALRDASNLLKNKFVSGAAGILTGTGTANPLAGLAIMGALEGGGRSLNGIANAKTKGQIQQLINLMAAGGARPARKAAAPYAFAPAITAPLLATPARASERPKQKSRRP